MNKIKKFKLLIKKNRYKLQIIAGVPKSTVDSWIYGQRYPSYENAKMIADFLGVKLVDIPYFRREHVI